MLPQTQFNVLEWIDAGEAVLRNVGTFGRQYDRTKVERFQKVNNLLAGTAINGASAPAIQRITVDGLWGPETANALKALIKRLPSAPLPSNNAETFRLTQWKSAAVQTALLLILSTRRGEVEAAMAATGEPYTVVTLTPGQAAGQEAGAAVDAAEQRLTDASPDTRTPIQPPSDVGGFRDVAAAQQRMEATAAALQTAVDAARAALQRAGDQRRMTTNAITAARAQINQLAEQAQGIIQTRYTSDVALDAGIAQVTPLITSIQGIAAQADAATGQDRGGTGFYLPGRREEAKTKSETPWLAIGLGVLAFGGVIFWATRKRRKK